MVKSVHEGVGGFYAVLSAKFLLTILFFFRRELFSTAEYTQLVTIP